MNTSNETNEKKDKKSKKNLKKLRRSQTNKINTEEIQLSKFGQNKNTIQNFEKLLITEQENFNKSSKNFNSSSEIKSGNR